MVKQMWSGQTWQVMLGELKSSGMTLQQIGDKVGLGRSAVCKLINGSVTPSRDSYKRIDAYYRRYINKARKQA